MPGKHDPTSVNRIFARMRAEAGVDQATWGARVGVRESTVSRWELGVRTPSRAHALSVLIALRDHPETDMDDLRLLATGWGIDPASIGIPEPLTEEVPPAPLPAPAPAPTAPPVDARRVVETAMLAASEDTDLSVRVVRRVFGALLGALEGGGVSVPEARAALVK
jgi:DNA-binding XRE family transcriptional regulator